MFYSFHGVWPTKNSPMIWEPASASFLFCCFSLVKKGMFFGRVLAMPRDSVKRCNTHQPCISVDLHRFLSDSIINVTTAKYIGLPVFLGFKIKKIVGIFPNQKCPSQKRQSGGETYVWYTSKRLCHFRERLHDRLTEALCTLDSPWFVGWSFWMETRIWWGRNEMENLGKFGEKVGQNFCRWL